MTLAITSVPDGELLSVEDAKRHLHVLSGDWDAEIAQQIREARDDCERDTGRTFREAVTRTYKAAAWWCKEYVPPFPPLLGVTSITYYDADNVSQTLSASNYTVLLSTDGHSRVVWAADASLPTVYDRADAITLTFTTGYASASLVPPVVIQAMKLKLTERWGGTENEMKAAEQSGRRLLSKVDVTSYA